MHITLFLRLAVIFCPAIRIKYTRPKLAAAPKMKMPHNATHTVFSRCRISSFCSARKK